MPGSVILLGGEPGIGKSTLLIQACAKLADAGGRVAYISGEEATAQVRMRAERLGLSGAPVRLAAATNVEDIAATLGADRYDLVVIDSIQTMWTETVDAAPGTVSQVRGAAQALIRYAKNHDACVILVGHVTKDGQIAGPRVVEHMVDAVMSFDGDAGHHFRILRAHEEPLRPDRRDRRLRDDRDAASPRSATLPPSSCRAATRPPPARRSSPAWRARGRCWSRSRPWWRRPRSARPGAPSWAGTRTASPW